MSRETKVTSLSLSLLHDIFIGIPSNTPSGTRFRPFNLPAGHFTRMAFDKAVLDMNPEEAGRFWVDQKIRGNVRQIRTVPSTSLLESVVANIPGAIAYIPLKNYRGKAKLVRIDSHHCAQPSYPLRMATPKHH